MQRRMKSASLGKWRELDIDPARRPAIRTKAPHQGFAQMSATARD
jgi:hypothetical protein